MRSEDWETHRDRIPIAARVKRKFTVLGSEKDRAQVGCYTMPIRVNRRFDCDMLDTRIERREQTARGFGWELDEMRAAESLQHDANEA